MERRSTGSAGPSPPRPNQRQRCLKLGRAAAPSPLVGIGANLGGTRSGWWRPPPLWGRDGERGRTAEEQVLQEIRFGDRRSRRRNARRCLAAETAVLESGRRALAAGASRRQGVFPSPHPSPTRGEGAAAQPSLISKLAPMPLVGEGRGEGAYTHRPRPAQASAQDRRQSHASAALRIFRVSAACTSSAGRRRFAPAEKCPLSPSLPHKGGGRRRPPLASTKLAPMPLVGEGAAARPSRSSGRWLPLSRAGVSAGGRGGRGVRVQRCQERKR